ncbi:hypothetical protein ACSW8S_18020 (plasmid) [Clostridium perfringens]
MNENNLNLDMFALPKSTNEIEKEFDFIREDLNIDKYNAQDDINLNIINSEILINVNNKILLDSSYIKNEFKKLREEIDIDEFVA